MNTCHWWVPGPKTKAWHRNSFHKESKRNLGELFDGHRQPYHTFSPKSLWRVGVIVPSVGIQTKARPEGVTNVVTAS